MNNENRCRRCGEGTIKSWSELTEEEREVVKRLPGAADYSAGEQRWMPQWCTRCWYESVSKQTKV